MLNLKISSLIAALHTFASAAAADLFNGQNLNGWYTYLVDTRYEDLRHVFSATNGTIRISGEGLGYLATKATYTNYNLSLEYRWGTKNHTWGDRVGKARDSGVFLHATGPDGNSDDGGGAFMAAIECNVFQGAVGDFLLIRGKDANAKLIAPRITTNVAADKDPDGWFTWHPHGELKTVERWGRINWRNKDPDWKDILDFRGRSDAEQEGWNQLECICVDGSVEIRLNGEVVNRAQDVWPRSGKILLQCEGSEIYFRNIHLDPK